MSTQQGIPGVPVGTKIAKLIRSEQTACYEAILAPDNVYGVCDLASVQLRPSDAEAYELRTPIAFRTPVADEPFVSDSGVVISVFSPGVFCGGDSRRLICRRKAPRTQRVLVVEYVEPTDSLIRQFAPFIDGSINAACAKERIVRVEERPIQ